METVKFCPHYGCLSLNQIAAIIQKTGFELVFECNYCGNKINEFDSEEDENGKIICSECFREQFMTTCLICENDFVTPDSEIGRVIAITGEVEYYQSGVGSDYMKNGFYRVLNQPIVDCGFCNAENLQFIADIDDDVSDYAPYEGWHSLCDECIAKLND